jgi:hypothetical protein
VVVVVAFDFFEDLDDDLAFFEAFEAAEEGEPFVINFFFDFLDASAEVRERGEGGGRGKDRR